MVEAGSGIVLAVPPPGLAQDQGRNPDLEVLVLVTEEGIVPAVAIAVVGYVINLLLIVKFYVILKSQVTLLLKPNQTPPREDRPERWSQNQSQETSSSRTEADSISQSQDGRKRSPVVNTEIRIGGMKTTSTADVEFLLDKRNAEKKEEMRKSNPDFFRAT